MEENKNKIMIDHWDENHKWFAWKQLGSDWWNIDVSNDGSYPKCPHQGWFVNRNHVVDWVKSQFHPEETEDTEPDKFPLNLDNLTEEQKQNIIDMIKQYQKQNEPRLSDIEKLAVEFYGKDYEHILESGQINIFLDISRFLMVHLIANAKNQKETKCLKEIAYNLGLGDL